MTDSTPAKRKPIRAGLGILLVVLGARGLYTFFWPSARILRPDNETEFAVMLLVPSVLAIGGVMMIINGLRTEKLAKSAQR